jgi:hypothetical protein
MSKFFDDYIQAQREEFQREQEQKDKWSERIRQNSTPNAPILRSVVKSMRNFSSQRDQGKIEPGQYQVLAMNLICKAISAGAFAGPEWLQFHTRLENDPSFPNAKKLLDTDAPYRVEGFKDDGTPLVDDGTWEISCLIDGFAKELENSEVPTKSQTQQVVKAQGYPAETAIPQTPNQPEDLPPGNWLMPPVSLNELSERLDGIATDKLHTLLDKYGLCNFPADNRQSWTIRLDPPMPLSLRKKIEANRKNN